MFRKDLKADRAYFDRKCEQFFYTVDGVGGTWYDTAKELREDTGYEGTIHHVSEIKDY